MRPPPPPLTLDNYFRFCVIQEQNIEILTAIPRTSGYQIFQAGGSSVRSGLTPCNSLNLVSILKQ